MYMLFLNFLKKQNNILIEIEKKMGRWEFFGGNMYWNGWEIWIIGWKKMRGSA